MRVRRRSCISSEAGQSVCGSVQMRGQSRMESCSKCSRSPAPPPASKAASSTHEAQLQMACLSFGLLVSKA